MSPDEFVLADMLVAARKAGEFVDGLSFEEFEASDLPLVPPEDHS